MKYHTRSAMALETISAVCSMNCLHKCLHRKGVINVLDDGTCIEGGKSQKLHGAYMRIRGYHKMSTSERFGEGGREGGTLHFAAHIFGNDIWKHFELYVWYSIAFVFSQRHLHAHGLRVLKLKNQKVTVLVWKTYMRTIISKRLDMRYKLEIYKQQNV